MKWKRSKKAQQEAKAKAQAEKLAKQNGHAPPAKAENKSKRITEEDEALSSDNEEEDIDVGAEDSDSLASPHSGLVAPTPIMGLPHPPALQLRPMLGQNASTQPPMIRPPHLESMETNLSALLPAHLARLSQAAAASGNRLYRPFVA